MNTYEQVQDEYRRAGWVGALPLPTGAKFPPPDGYTGREGAWPTEDDRAAWSADPGYGNVALRLPDTAIGLDVDHGYKGKTGADTLVELEKRYGPLPATYRSGSRDKGGILLFRVQAGTTFPGQAGKDVDVIQHGHRYLVCWPSFHPDTGQQYRWRDPSGAYMDGVPRISDLPALPEPWVAGLARDAVHYQEADLSDSDVWEWVSSAREGDGPCPSVAEAVEKATSNMDGAAGSRYDTMVGAVWRLVNLAAEGHAGLQVALDSLADAYETAVGKERDVKAELHRAVEGAVRKVASEHPTPGGSCDCDLPVVHMWGPAGGLPEVLAALPRIPGLYNQSGRLAIVNEEGQLPIIDHADKGTIRNRFGKYASVWKRTERGPEPALLSAALAEAALEDTVFEGVPKVDRVIALPSFREDGSLITEPGYDPQSGLFLAKHSVPTNMTLSEAKDILFGKVLHDFPWTNAASFANAVALVLTQPLRPYLGESVVPFGLVSAGMQGSGKTKLATVISRAAGGDGRAMMDPGYEEERGKVINTRMISSDPVIILDNVKSGSALDSPALSGVVTSFYLSIRPMGTTYERRVTNDRLWVITGNNIAVGADNRTRTVWVELDPHTPNPEKRTGFAVADLDGWLAVNSDLLIGAVLTILREWFAAGAPEIPTTMRNFTRWASVMAGILAWLEIPGFLTNEADVEDVDTEYQDWATVFAALESVRGGAPGSVRDIVTSLGAVSPEDDGPLATLHALVGKSSNKAVGQAFRTHKGRYYGGRRIVEAGKDRTGTLMWKVEVSPDALPAPEFSAPAPVLPLQRKETTSLEPSAAPDGWTF